MGWAGLGWGGPGKMGRAGRRERISTGKAEAEAEAEADRRA